MKNIFCKSFTVVLIFIISHAIVFSQDIPQLNFLSNFKKAQKLAKDEDKLILVFIYVDNKRSQRMFNEVFVDEEVARFFSKRFVCVKMAAAKGLKSYESEHGVHVVPSLLYYDADGTMMHSIEGFAGKERLMRSANDAFRNPMKKQLVLSEGYAKNKKDPDFLKEYIFFCEETGDWEKLDVLTNQYAKQISKVDSVEWMDMVMRFTHRDDTRFFRLLKKNKSAFNTLYGKDEVDFAFIEVIMNSEIWKMKNLTADEFVINTQNRIAKINLDIEDNVLFPQLARKVYDPEIAFEKNMARTDFAIQVIKQYQEGVDDAILFDMVATIAIDKKDNDALEIANDFLDSYIEIQPTMFLHDVKSIVLYKLGEKEASYKQVALANQYAVATKQEYKSSLRVMKKAGLIE